MNDSWRNARTFEFTRCEVCSFIPQYLLKFEIENAHLAAPEVLAEGVCFKSIDDAMCGVVQLNAGAMAVVRSFANVDAAGGKVYQRGHRGRRWR